MTDLELTLACHRNDRTEPLFDSEITPNGIDLNCLEPEIEEMFFRMLHFREFDVCEMSMSSYMMTRDQGEMDIIAIPAFPSRTFRHDAIFVNTNAGIEKPADLREKRVGVPEYQMTAALWVRAILQHQHDVAPKDMHWFHGGLEEGGREERVDLHLPQDVQISYIDPTETLADLLADHEIDALVSPRLPSTFEDDSVERLFPDYRTAERDYYRETGFFPIMHTIVMHRDVYEEHEWAAQELLKAFREAKNRSLEKIRTPGVLGTSLPWLLAEVDDTRELMGDDYWPYGIEKNRDILTAMTEYSFEQGLIEEELSVGELFAPTTYERYRI